jgi:tetratricopeptide (TPR) repeat protein
MSTISYKIHRSKGIIAFSIALGMLCAAGISSCKKYLDAKPNQSLVLPSTLADCQALLDDFFTMHTGQLSTEYVADNYYNTYAGWQTLLIDTRNSYIWDPQANTAVGAWQQAYQTVLYANQALQTLGNINPATDPDTWNFVKGQALFFRAYSFYNIAQMWARPYSSTAATDPGIPLRLTPDISVVSKRGTVQQTYNQVIQDLTAAAALLPATQPTSIIGKSRPCRAAAYAALARVYLSMGDYANAGINANNSLNNYSTLIDYNQVNPATGFPFPKFNDEVLFDAYAGIANMSSSKGIVDSNLYASYVTNDLRKTCFFRQNTGANTGTYQFIGGYDGTPSNTQFAGLATDEMYLTRAECYARAGNTAAAMTDLNTLLSKRFVTGTYTATATTADDALVQILVERRKELLFRGLRWTDLRRLNMDPRFAITLKRVLNGVTYTLPPNDLRYTLLIPLAVEQVVSLPQNPR